MVKLVNNDRGSRLFRVRGGGGVIIGDLNVYDGMELLVPTSAVFR